MQHFDALECYIIAMEKADALTHSLGLLFVQLQRQTTVQAGEVCLDGTEVAATLAEIAVISQRLVLALKAATLYRADCDNKQLEFWEKAIRSSAN